MLTSLFGIVIHYDLSKDRFQRMKVKVFVSVTRNYVRTDSKEFNLKWLLLQHTKQALSHFTWLNLIKRISNSIVQRPKDPRGKKLQMASQYSPSYWHLVKDGFRNTVNFCLAWNSNNQHMQIVKMFSCHILHSIFMKKDKQEICCCQNSGLKTSTNICHRVSIGLM